MNRAEFKALEPKERIMLLAEKALGLDVDRQKERLNIVMRGGNKGFAPLPEYSDFHKQIREKMEADGIAVSARKLPRSTLSIVTAKKDDRIVESPVMPENSGVLYCALEFYP